MKAVTPDFPPPQFNVFCGVPQMHLQRQRAGY
jgi:hypothetical protein